MNGHVYKFGKRDQGCQCAACKHQRLIYASPHLLDALDRLVALVTIAAAEHIVIHATHPAVVEARSALEMVQS